MSNKKQITPDVLMEELLRIHKDPETPDEVIEYLTKNLWRPLKNQPYGIGGKKKRKGANYVDLDSLKQIITDVDYLLKSKKTAKPKKKPDTFKYTMPVTTLANAYNITPSKFKEVFNVAGDTLYLNESELKSFESRAGKIFNPSKGKFTLKPNDKEKYSDALTDFKWAIENEEYDRAKGNISTLTAIRPEIADSLNSVIKVAKNPKIPQVKKEGWLSKAWNSLSTAWDKTVQHYK